MPDPKKRTVGGTTESNREEKSEYTYNPQLGEWDEISIDSGMLDGMDLDTSEISDASVADSSLDTEVDSGNTAESETVEEEYNILEGELTPLLSIKTDKVKRGDTIYVSGIGRYLTGSYFVKEIKRELDSSSGYSMTFTLMRIGFADTLKDESTVSTSRSGEIAVETNFDFVLGDKVTFCDDYAIYSNAHEGVPVPSWVREKTFTVDALSNDGTRVRLKEVWSWTYVKYLKKV